jgi:hypothetical protein
MNVMSRSRGATPGTPATSRSPLRAPPIASSGRLPPAPRVVWLLLAAVCLIYGPISINFTWHLFVHGAPWLWDHIYTAIVGRRQAEGPGSAFLRQQQAYERSRVALLAHTMAGGGAVMLAVGQFSTRLRAGRPVLHRAIGRAYLILVLIGMVTAAAYLIQIGPYGTFDGPPFYMLLWSLDLGTVLTAILALLAIRRREVSNHQSLIALNFALLFSAPLLRLLWLGFGVLAPSATQSTIVLLSAAIATVALLGGAIIASRHFDNRRGPGGERLEIVSIGAARVVSALAALAAVCVAVGYLSVRGPLDSTLVGAVSSVAAWLVLCTLSEWRAGRRHDFLAAADWRVHRVAIMATGIPLAIAWPLLSIPFTVHQAFGGAALTAPGSTMTLGILVVLRQRRRSTPIRHASPSAAASARSKHSAPAALPVEAG